MEQLTDIELHLLDELLSAHALAITKAEGYASALHDEPLRRLAQEAADVHRHQFDQLMALVHAFSGGMDKPEGSPR